MFDFFIGIIGLILLFFIWLKYEEYKSNQEDMHAKENIQRIEQIQVEYYENFFKEMNLPENKDWLSISMNDDARNSEIEKIIIKNNELYYLKVKWFNKYVLKYEGDLDTDTIRSEIKKHYTLNQIDLVDISKCLVVIKKFKYDYSNIQFQYSGSFTNLSSTNDDEFYYFYEFRFVTSKGNLHFETYQDEVFRYIKQYIPNLIVKESED